MDDETKRALRLLRQEVEKLSAEQEAQRIDTLRVVEGFIKPMRADVEDMRMLVQALHILVTKHAGEQVVFKAQTDQFKISRRRWAWRLSQLIIDHFSEQDVELLAYELAVDIENVLVGKGKNGRVINLVEHFRHREQLSTLATRCQQARPQIQWPLLASDVKIKE